MVETGTSFKKATLDDAIFDSSTLAGANFINASMNRTSWWNVRDLDCIIPGNKYLNYPQIRKIFQEYSGEIEREYLNFDNLNLEGINFSNKNLTGATFVGTNLSKSNLRESQLRDAQLTFSNLSGADLTKANLTGVYFKDIRYDQETIFRNVICEYINLHDPNCDTKHRRFPPIQDFRPGDFENYYLTMSPEYESRFG